MNEKENFRFSKMILKFVSYMRRRCVYVFAKTRVILLIAHASERFQCEARTNFTLYHIAVAVVQGSFFNSFVPLSILYSFLGEFLTSDLVRFFCAQGKTFIFIILWFNVMYFERAAEEVLNLAF